MTKSYTEQPVSFQVGQNRLHGIEAIPECPNGAGVIIIVGGPQYRVGSHRQFISLARSLAKQGVRVLRFDYTGMGYSEGFPRDFCLIDDDISAALDYSELNWPEVSGVYLWGLCDAATAIAFSLYKEQRPKGAILLNPWVRSEASHSQVLLTNYYRKRFLDLDVWKNLIFAPSKIFQAIRSLVRVLWKTLAASQKSSTQATSGLSERERRVDIGESMRKGLLQFDGRICFILSENDLTADEFKQVMQQNDWLADSSLSARTQVFEMADATHTFSSQIWRSKVEKITYDFVQMSQPKS